jgi:hypothetical protein
MFGRERFSTNQPSVEQVYWMVAGVKSRAGLDSKPRPRTWFKSSAGETGLGETRFEQLDGIA